MLLYTRLYLRMLIGIPGEPLRKILRQGDKRVEEANASQYNTVSSKPGKQATQVSFFMFQVNAIILYEITLMKLLFSVSRFPCDHTCP